jgi:hypothetical protein
MYGKYGLIPFIREYPKLNSRSSLAEFPAGSWEVGGGRCERMGYLLALVGYILIFLSLLGSMVGHLWQVK